MKPHELRERLTEIVEEAVRDALPPALQKTKTVIRRQVPGNRTKTRRAVQSRVRRHRKGYQAIVRLRFQQKYKSRGTRTEQLFEHAWTTAEPVFRREFERNLSKHLNRN